MKKRILVLALMLATCGAPQAEADVAFPGEPYRPPHRPPIERPAEQPKEATLDVTAEPEEGGGKLLFHFGFPDIGTYEYRIKDLKTGEYIHASAGAYNAPVPGKVTAEFPYYAPEEGEGLYYLLEVYFSIVRREPTSFGPKIGSQPDEQEFTREINITTKDGKTQVIVSQGNGWKEIG